MSDQSFTTTFLVDQTPEVAFAAINNVRGWWSEEIEGDTGKLGAVFKFHADDLHHSTQQITELEPGKKVVWHVVDSRINYVKDKAEWTGTDIVFEITRQDAKTELRFTHAGLVRAFECYDSCSDAWGFYIKHSLFDLITKGQGEPARKDQAAAAPAVGR